MTLAEKRAKARAWYHKHKKEIQARKNAAYHSKTKLRAASAEEKSLPPGAKHALLKQLERAYIAELRNNGGQLNDLIVRAYAVCQAFR